MIKPIQFLRCAGFLATCLLLCNGSTHAYRSGRVTYVFDGDTIKVGQEKVRLIGVDTPEQAWRKKGQKLQCYAAEAKTFLTKMLLRKTVHLKGDRKISRRDKYGRRLAFIYFNDILVNAELIQQGYGFAYRIFPHSKSAAFIALEGEAKRERRGLWKACKVVCRDQRCETRFR